MPARDSQVRVSRQTLARLAEFRGTSETDVIHYALRRLADETLPRYEPDNGPLSESQTKRIQEIANLPELGETCSSLFEDE
ncbi:MAG: hypothetical protein KC800_19265 [Candidatus Eremiobacteraeota bacterium]|nr:hypothetical protein [Candidatus Eremiobacteraeota bacterium]